MSDAGGGQRSVSAPPSQSAAATEFTKLSAEFFYDREFVLGFGNLHRQEANGHLLLLQHGDLSLRTAALLDGSTADFAFGPPRQRASRASASAAAAKIFCRKYEADEAQIAGIVDFYVELYASAIEYHQRIDAASSGFRGMFCCGCGIQSEATAAFNDRTQRAFNAMHRVLNSRLAAVV